MRKLLEWNLGLTAHGRLIRVSAAGVATDTVHHRKVECTETDDLTGSNQLFSSADHP